MTDLARVGRLPSRLDYAAKLFLTSELFFFEGRWAGIARRPSMVVESCPAHHFVISQTFCTETHSVRLFDPQRRRVMLFDAMRRAHLGYDKLLRICQPDIEAICDVTTAPKRSASSRR